MADETNGRIGLIFERQWLHLLCLAILLAGCAWASGFPAVRQGGLWGLRTIDWYWIAILVPVAHQVFVWLCWRSELHGRSMTRLFGNGAFGAYSFGFAVLGISRILAMFVLGYANRDSLVLNPTVMKIAAILALIPALYLFYSVRRYFSFKRALGIDHFDPAWAEMPFERRGIFRYSENGMYVFGFLLLWVPGLWWGSAAALAAALFNHLYIWVHFYATELPDIRRIYRNR